MKIQKNIIKKITMLVVLFTTYNLIALAAILTIGIWLIVAAILLELFIIQFTLYPAFRLYQTYSCIQSSILIKTMLESPACKAHLDSIQRDYGNFLKIEDYHYV